MSARRRATYNWHILRTIGEQLRDVFKADLSRPLSPEMMELVDRFADAHAKQRAGCHADRLVDPTPEGEPPSCR